MLQRAFPFVKIVCAAVDDHLREMWLECEEDEDAQPTEGRKVWVVEPGMGHIGMLFSTVLRYSDITDGHSQGIGTISRDHGHIIYGIALAEASKSSGCMVRR